MKIKTSELTKDALNCAVALAEGGTGLHFDTVSSWWITIGGREVTFSKGWSNSQRFRPSDEWDHAGPIIRRERISIMAPIVRRIGKEKHALPVDYWRAMICTDENEPATHGKGATELVAAMICFVRSKLGDEVDIPEGLL